MLFKNSVRTSNRTPHFTITNVSLLTLFKELMYVYSQNPTTRKYKMRSWLNIKVAGAYSYHSALKC
jgi:hypothetical protein